MNLTSVLTATKKGLNFIWINREILMGAVIILLLALLFHKPSSVTTTVTVQDPLILQQLKEQKDLNGKLYATINTQIIERGALGRTIDSLAKALKIKPKFIQGAAIVKTIIDTFYRDTGTHKIVVIGGDTAHVVQHHDPWVDITAYAYTNPKNWHLDHIDFHLTDSLYFVQIHKNPLLGFIGRPTDEIIVRSADPNNHIVAGTSVKVKEKTPWLVLGIGGGYTLLPNQNWDLGIYVITPIFSLKR